MRKISITLKLTHKKHPGTNGEENIPDVLHNPIDIVVYDAPNLHLPVHHAEYLVREFNKFIDYPGRKHLKPSVLLLGKEFELPMPHTGYLITANDISYVVLKAIEEELLEKQLEQQASPMKQFVHPDDCWEIKCVETCPTNIKTDLSRIKIPKTATILPSNTVIMEDGKLFFIIIYKD